MGSSAPPNQAPPVSVKWRARKALHPRPEGLAGALRVGHPAGVGLDQRAPALKLLDVLDHDDARAPDLRVAGDRPGERALALGALAVAEGLGAAGLGEVGAVGAEPDQRDRPAREHVLGPDVPDVPAQVDRVRVVDLVHGQRLRVVVHGHVRAAPDGLFDPGAGAAAAGEAIDDDLVGVDADQLDGAAHATILVRGGGGVNRFTRPGSSGWRPRCRGAAPGRPSWPWPSACGPSRP